MFDKFHQRLTMNERSKMTIWYFSVPPSLRGLIGLPTRV